LTILPDDETQFQAYQNQTIEDVNITFTSPYMVNATTPFSMVLEIPQLSIGDYTRTQINTGAAIAQGATMPFVGIYESGHSGAARLTVVDRLPL